MDNYSELIKCFKIVLSKPSFLIFCKPLFAFFISSSILDEISSFVNNLYANYSYILVGQASGTPFYFYQGPTTGSSVATFVGTNKPGGTSGNNSWLEFIINGTSYQIPVWAS